MTCPSTKLNPAHYSTCFLIEFSRILYLLEKNITENSKTILKDKVIKLFNSSNSDQFLEDFLEFQFADHLSTLINPVMLEPFTELTEELKKINKQKSPDFAVRFPDGDICFEVTVFKGHFKNWENNTAALGHKINKFLTKKKLSYKIKMNFPFNIKNYDFDTPIYAAFKKLLIENPSGVWNFDKESYISWEPIPQLKISMNDFLAKNDSNFNEFAKKHGSFIVGETEAFSTIIEKKIVVNEFTGDKFFNSYDSKIADKRHQFKHPKPYIIVIKIDHGWLNSEYFKEVTVNRIFKNNKNQSISGICFFKPRTSFEKNSPHSSLELILNPLATSEVPDSFKQIFFHN